MPTLSIELICINKRGDHTFDAYSKSGLMQVIYTLAWKLLESSESLNWNQFAPWTSYIDELFDPCLKSTVYIIIGCDQFDRSLLNKITLNFCHLISSSTLGEVPEGLHAVVILLVNLFVIKVRSEIRGCGHTVWTLMNLVWVQTAASIFSHRPMR